MNYLAVVAAAISNMVLGFLWFGPLFGKQWMAMMNYTPEKMDAAKQQGMMAKTYIIALVGALLMAFVLSHALVFASSYLKVTGLYAGLTAGFWNWLGFMVPVIVGSVLWEGKSWKFFFLTGGYYLVALCAMGVILVSWPA